MDAGEGAGERVGDLVVLSDLGRAGCAAGEVYDGGRGDGEGAGDVVVGILWDLG